MEKYFDIDTFLGKAIEMYSDMLFRISYQYVRNRHDAEDVLQDVFLSLVKIAKKEKFNGEEHLKAWLIRVTIRKSINVAKYNARRSVAPLDERMGRDDETKELIRIINMLPPLDREIIYLYYYEGYSVKEISSFVGKSERSVYKRMSRARAGLKGLIEEGGGI